MQTANLKFTRIEVPDFERKGLINIKFFYELDGQEGCIEKQYGYINDDPAGFAEDLVAEAKRICRSKAKPDYEDDGALAGYVHVQMQEARPGQTAERIGISLKQIQDKIRGIKSMVTANNYLVKYIDIKGLVIEL